MSSMQYIGARYVPIWYVNSIDGSADWESNVNYEPLTFVTTNNGHLYISKKSVPDNIGTPAMNIDYWLDMGSFTGSYTDLVEKIGDLALLNTTDKTDLVSAINEVDANVKNLINERHILFCGDSYGMYNGADSYPDICASVMGLDSDHYSNLCVGRANFVKTISGYTKYLDQLVNYTGDRDLITDIVLCGGTNERADVYNDVLTAMNEFTTYAKAEFKNAKLWLGLLGWSKNNDAGPNEYTWWDTVRMEYFGAATFGFTVIRDLYPIYHYFPFISSDGVHPSIDGAKAIGRALASKLKGGDCTCLVTGKNSQINFEHNDNIFASVTGGMRLQFNPESFVISFQNFSLAFKSSQTLTANTDVTLGTISSEFIRGGSGTFPVSVPVLVRDATDLKMYEGFIRPVNDSLVLHYNGLTTANPQYIKILTQAEFDILNI